MLPVDDAAVTVLVPDAAPTPATSPPPTAAAVLVPAAAPSPNGAIAAAVLVPAAAPVPVIDGATLGGGGGRRCCGSCGGRKRATPSQFISHTSSDAPIVSESAGAAAIRRQSRPEP